MCIMVVWARKFINNIALFYFVGIIGRTIFHDKVMSSQIVIIYVEFQIRISFYRLHFITNYFPNDIFFYFIICMHLTFIKQLDVMRKIFLLRTIFLRKSKVQVFIEARVKQSVCKSIVVNQ